MSNPTDPSWHQAAERRAVGHARSLVEQGSLPVMTTRGIRPVDLFGRQFSRSDHGVELKRMMAEANRPDFGLQQRMPVGEQLDVTLSRRRWGVWNQTVGHLRILCVSPTAELLKDQEPTPLDAASVRRVLSSVPPPLSGLGGHPVTTVLVSTAGFTADCAALATADGNRTLVLLEPDAAGGWSTHAPAIAKDFAAAVNPEGQYEKLQRVKAAIDELSIDLLTGGISAEKLAQKTRLPLKVVESALKQHARESPGLRAKALDGRTVLYRESTPVASGGEPMPLMDKMKSLFGRRGEVERKAAMLAERKAALAQQRDQSYEDVGALEAKEAELRESFKENANPIARRRITSQMVQLRKDIERRAQLLTVLNQQINVVSTHLHNLTLVQQGSTAKLPPSEEIAEDAVAAEEVLATLQADSELADSVGGHGVTGMSDEEQALYEELEREAGESPEQLAGGTSGDRFPAKPQAAKTPADRAAPDPSRARTEPEAG